MHEFVDLPVQLLALLAALGIVAPILREARHLPNEGELVGGMGSVGLGKLRKRAYFAFVIFLVLGV